MPWGRRPGGPVINRAVWNANQASYTRWAWARRGWAFLVLKRGMTPGLRSGGPL